MISPGLNISVSDAMASPELFGPYFEGPSWNAWRVVIKAAYGEPLSADELSLFHSIAGERSPPTHPVSELISAAGRGAGKDSAASLFACTAAINFNPAGKLRPGERVFILAIAVDRAQAQIVFGYIRGLFEEIPALRALVSDFGTESIELKNQVVVEVHTNSFRAVRGRTLLCVIFDEAAFWRDENSASPDVEMDRAVGPGLARMPNSLKIIISSVHKRSGVLYQKIKDYYGKDDPDVLAVMGPTMTFNPTFDARIIEKALLEDPERYGAEYLCRWRDDLSSFIGRELLDSAVDKGVIVRPPINGVKYIAGCDPSGGRNDSFTWAIAHRDRENYVILDVAGERKAPFNPAEVVDEIVRVMKDYRCYEITGDHYSANWVIKSFAKVGRKYIQSDRDRSAVYMNALPLFSSGRARLLDNAKLVSQFAALERRTFSTGRERIDPGPGHDDLANSTAIAMSLAASATPAFIIPDAMLERGRLETAMRHANGGWSAPPSGYDYPSRPGNGSVIVFNDPTKEYKNG